MVMMVTVMVRQLEKRMLLHSLLRKTATLNAGMPLLFRILVSGLHRVLRRQINRTDEVDMKDARTSSLTGGGHIPQPRGEEALEAVLDSVYPRITLS